MKLTVASIAFRVAFDIGARNGAPMAAIASRVGLSQPDLRNPLKRMSWTQLLDFMEQTAEALGGPEALRMASMDWVDSVPDLAALVAHFVTPQPMLRFVLEVAESLVVPMVRWKVTARAPLHFSLELTARPGCEWRSLYGVAAAGTLAGLPRYLGQSDALVTYVATPRGAKYEMRWKPWVDRPHPEGEGNPLLRSLQVMGLDPRPSEPRPRETIALEQLLHELSDSIDSPVFVCGPRDLLRPLNGPAVTCLSDGGGVLAQVRAFANASATERSGASGLKAVSLVGGRTLVIVPPLAATPQSGADVGRRLADQVAHWGLTDRQREVLGALLEGRSNKDIAQVLRCAPKTIAVHVSALLQKAAVDSRSSLIAKFWKG